MSIKARGEILSPTNQVNLMVQFRDVSGNPINVDSLPQVSIVQPSGLVLLAPTSMGVANVGAGKYSYIFTVPYNGPYGVFNDIWSAYINGFKIQQEFSFVVAGTNLPAINSDGYVHLGDDPGFNYSQCAIKNINKLIKLLRARLNGRGKAKAADQYGNTVYVDCDIYSVDMLTSLLAQALTEFNETPFFTFFTFDDDNFVNQFMNILVEGASIWSLASQALIERGREIQVTDNGVSFQMPTVSELLQTQYSALLTLHYDKLKFIKASLRPHPLGLGTLGMNSGINPAWARLRHTRNRRLY